MTEYKNTLKNMKKNINENFKVKNYKEYALFDYESNINPFALGDIVTREPLEEWKLDPDFDGNNTPEIGVVIQIHDTDELRTDMFGNESASKLKPSTLEEIQKYRPKLMKDVIKNEKNVLQSNMFGSIRNSQINEEDGGGAAGSGDGGGGGVAYATKGGGMGEISNATVSDIPGDPDGSIAGSGDIAVPFGVYQKANAGKGGTRFTSFTKQKKEEDPNNIKRSQEINHVKDNLGINTVQSFADFTNENFDNFPNRIAYKLRAEGAPDIAEFISIASPYLISYKMEHVGVPDVEFEFETNLTLDEVIEILKNVPDGHVMYQSVQPIADYTGERDDNRY